MLSDAMTRPMNSPNVIAVWIITTIIERGGVRLSSLLVASRKPVIEMRIPNRINRFSALPPTHSSSSSWRKTSHQTGRSGRSAAVGRSTRAAAAVMRWPPQ
jgi:hypothetical protein